jgi:hypothetical protein
MILRRRGKSYKKLTYPRLRCHDRLTRKYKEAPMRRVKDIKVLARALGIMTAVIIIVSGVTFAALQSQQAVLKGNTIKTAMASLKVSSNGASYSDTLAGFTFDNLVPGGGSSPADGYAYPFFLKNTGTTALKLKLNVSKQLNNPDGVDLSKVHVILTSYSGGPKQTMTLQDLIDESGTGNGGVALTAASRMLGGETMTFTLQVIMDSDAVSGPTATISNIDFSFGAIAAIT